MPRSITAASCLRRWSSQLLKVRASAGFFGKNVQATLTVYAVDGTAPALTGNEKPISNVVRETFTIAG